jgi:hypothetical protein
VVTPARKAETSPLSRFSASESDSSFLNAPKESEMALGKLLPSMLR